MRSGESHCSGSEAARIAALKAALGDIGLQEADTASIAQGHALGAALLPGAVLSADALCELQAATGAGLFAFAENGRVAGVVGYLPLRASGLCALQQDRFDLATLEHASARDEAPAAIYLLGAAGDTDAGKRAVMKATAAIADAFATIPVFTRIATPEGERALLDRLGFARFDGSADLAWRAPRPAPAIEQDGNRRSAARVQRRLRRASTAGTLPRRDAIQVSVARTLDDLMQVVALRSATYIGEQDCPYEEEFDGNDFSGATHFIARVGREPIGVGRVRWFADFAKGERAAVLDRYRHTSVAFALFRAGVEMAARKGYKRMLGHVEPELVPMWKRARGVTLRADRPAFTFSDRTYVEILVDVPACHNALTIDSDALTLLRPEGDWDREGVLDRSSERAGFTQL